MSGYFLFCAVWHFNLKNWQKKCSIKAFSVTPWSQKGRCASGLEAKGLYNVWRAGHEIEESYVLVC